jgi:hypothetical protein
MKKLRNKSRRRKPNGKYLNSRTRESYMSYKRQREVVKKLVNNECHFDSINFPTTKVEGNYVKVTGVATF